MDYVFHFLSLSWLTGPIFDKELRVSSRRRRNYVLRFVYLALLTVFLVLMWVEVVEYHHSWFRQAAQMAVAGQYIIAFIVWFQFCATQIVAVIMLSTSISDEIYNRTLGVLMTTPISSFQIVMGKLFSKLLQLILLLGISLPLLAVVRIFGGVPWDYIICSLCITLAAVLFVGSLSLFFSIFSRRAYVVIIATVLTAGVLFALLPFLAALTIHVLDLDSAISEKTLFGLFFHSNPYGMMVWSTVKMFNPVGRGMPVMYWPLHCGIMLGAAALVLLMAVVRVRKVALRQATGQLDTSKPRRRARNKGIARSSVWYHRSAQIRRINGCPAIWKELRTPIFRTHRTAALVVISVAILVLFVTYGLWHIERELDEEEVHMMYVTTFMSLGMLFTIVLPATSITSEKESRCWPLLLATTLDDGQILFGKFVGVVRRCLPVWLFLFGHLLLFVMVGYIHPLAIVLVAMLVVWVIVFLSGSGLYFSCRFRRTTTAVIMNFALAAVIWGLVPILLFVLADVADLDEDFAEFYMNGNPIFQGLVVMDATANGWHIRDFDWLDSRLGPAESILFMLAFMLVYILLGFLFFQRAKRRVRRNIF
ncbi:MAG: ABC transporter permease subunit [Planctomycetota bacterium]